MLQPLCPSSGGAIPPAIATVTPFVVGTNSPAPPVALEMVEMLALNAAPFEPQPSVVVAG